MNIELQKITDTEAWKKIKSFLVNEAIKLRDIDYPVKLSTDELKVLEITKDPFRVGQMFAYRTLKEILEVFINLEEKSKRDTSKDSFS